MGISVNGHLNGSVPQLLFYIGNGSTFTDKNGSAGMARIMHTDLSKARLLGCSLEGVPDCVL